jgi:hypothetical protein
MAESSVSIKLVTTSDTSGAVQTADAVKKVEQATKAANSADAQRSANAAAAATSLSTLHGAQEKAAGSSRNMGNALLQGSRALQDMQYGLAGAVNNLEGIASALGLGAGVAGIVTVLAVTVQTLGPKVIEWFNSLDSEGKRLDDFKSKLSASADALLGEWTPATQAASDASDAFKDKIEAEKAALDSLAGSLSSSLDLLKQRNKLTADIGENEDAAAIEEIKAKGLPAQQEAGEIARIRIARLNALKQAAEGEIVAEEKVAQANLDNAEAAAQQAAERQKQLEAEKQRTLLRAELLKEIGGEAEVKDDKGNIITPARRGALDRVAAAQANVSGAESLRNLPGVDTAFANEQLIKATQQLAQERQRLADLEAEAAQNIAENDGSAEFRTVETIDAELNQAGAATKSFEEEREAARKAKAEQDSMRQLQRQKIASDYSRQSGEVLKTLPQEAVPKPREEPDEWELASRVQPVERPRRNLAAEEAAGSGGFQGRNLAAEEKEINTAPLNKTSESNDKVNAAVLAFAQTVAAKNDELTRKLTDLETKVKNARP